VSHALERAVNFRCGHQLSFFYDAHGPVIIDEVGREVKEVDV
jgi:hypothetical protein